MRVEKRIFVLCEIHHICNGIYCIYPLRRYLAYPPNNTLLSPSIVGLGTLAQEVIITTKTLNNSNNKKKKLTFVFLSLLCRTMEERPSWEHLCAQKKAEIKAKIPRDWLLEASVVDRAKSTRKISGAFIEALLNPFVRDITAQKTVELVDNLRRGSLTAHMVTEALCKRAAVAQQIVIPRRLP
jgi:hypothetical protein